LSAKGAKLRREDRGAEGAEGVEREEGIWGGSCAPSQKNFSILDFKQVNFGAN